MAMEDIYNNSSYLGRIVVKWPHTGTQSQSYGQTVESLKNTIRQAQMALAVEKAGGRRKVLEQSIENAKKLLKELGAMGNKKLGGRARARR